MKPFDVTEVVNLHLGPLPPPQSYLALKEPLGPPQPVEANLVNVDGVQVGEHLYQLLGAGFELIGRIRVELRARAHDLPVDVLGHGEGGAQDGRVVAHDDGGCDGARGCCAARESPSTPPDFVG